MRGSPFVADLPPSRFTYGSTEGADFASGGVCIVGLVLSSVSTTNNAHKSNRSTVENRLSLLGVPRSGAGVASGRGGPAGRTSTSVCQLLVYVDIGEPDLDVLTYVNELGIAKGAQLFMAWTPGVAAAYILSACAPSTSGVAAVARPKRNDSAMSTLLDFLMTSKVMQRPDATRFADNFETPAELLAATLQDLEALPRFGGAKAKRMHSILHTEFPTTERRLGDYQASAPTQRATVPTLPPHTAAPAGRPATSARPATIDVAVDVDAIVPAPGASVAPRTTTAAKAFNSVSRLKPGGGGAVRRPRADAPIAIAEALARRRETEDAEAASQLLVAPEHGDLGSILGQLRGGDQEQRESE
jgi:hypothetical protein